MRTTNSRRALLVLSTAALVLTAVPASRHAILRAAGTSLVAKDTLARSDVGVITEFGEGSELEIADLYRERLFSRVVVLEPSPTAVDREYVRRGVYRDDIVVTTLRQLGIPDTAITTVEAGEGGTTESTEALADWMRVHPSHAIVVVASSHTRRYRRTLHRVWPGTAPPPLVTYPRQDEFRADDWWGSRRSRREGIVELQKLAWDYLQHAW